VGLNLRKSLPRVCDSANMLYSATYCILSVTVLFTRDRGKKDSSARSTWDETEMNVLPAFRH
jgi:hypothetical protein